MLTMHATPKTTGAASALLHTAAGIAHVQPHCAMTPEAVLLALLCDPAFTDLDAEMPEESELERAILASNERGVRDGWSRAAWDAYMRGWQRASERARRQSIGERVRATFAAVASSFGVPPIVLSMPGTLSVGDLIHGLGGSTPLVDALLRRRALEPEPFDGEAEMPEVDHHATVADDAMVDVIAVNDDVTPMEFVVTALQRHFGLDALRATYCMYRVDACGRARVARCERRLAEQKIDAVYEEARASSFPLAFVYGPRSAADTTLAR